MQISNRRNSLWLGFQFVTTSIFAFVNLKLNFLTYGSQLYGIWILISSIWGFSSALDLGFGTSLIKFVSTSLANNRKNFSQILATSLVVFLVFGLIIVVSVFLLSNYILFLDKTLIPSNYYEQTKSVIFYLAISFYVRYQTIYFRSILEGMNLYEIVSKINILYNISIFISVLLAYLYNLNIVLLAILHLLSAIINAVILIWIFFNKVGKNAISLKEFDKNVLKEISSFSFSIQFISLFGVIIDPIIKYIIGIYFSASYITYYEVARRFSLAISGFFSTAFRNFITLVSARISFEQKKQYLLNESLELTKIGITFSGIFFGILSIITSSIIYYFYGMQEAVLIFLIMSLAESVNNFGYSNYVFLLGIGKTKPLIIVQLTNLILTITLLTYVAIMFNSIIGIAGYFISVIIGNLIIISVIKNEFHFNLLKYLTMVKFIKLLALLLMLLLVISIYLQFNFSLILFGSLTVASIVIFTNDIKYVIIKIIKK